jgi:hypothetical protein
MFKEIMVKRIKGKLHRSQGDQMGQVLAYWAIVLLGQCFLITEGTKIFGQNCFQRKSYSCTY